MALTACRVDDNDLFQDCTAAERMASEIFLDAFNVCMNKSADDLEDDLKSYSNLMVGEGWLRTLPGVQIKMRAFIQWLRDQICTDLDPTTRPFPVDQVASLLYRKETHDNFVRMSKTLSEAAKPTFFTKDVRWEDFNPNLSAYLRLIPGRNGHSFLYVIREEELPNQSPNPVSWMTMWQWHR